MPKIIRARPYQAEALQCLLNDTANGSAALAVLATGCGKTVLFSLFIDAVLSMPENHGKRVLVLAHREELINQAQDKVESVTGRHATVEMGERWAVINDWFNPVDVVVSSIQTQNANNRMARFDPAHFCAVIIDEAHHSVSKSYLRVLNHYRRNAALRVVGVTATPDRADASALGQVFDIVSFNYDVADAISDGWLVPIEQQMVTISSLDLSQIRTTAGDLNGGDLAAVLEEEENLYGVADATYRISGARKTLIFCESVRQADALADILNRYRPGCAHAINGRTDRITRARLLEEYAAGDFQFLVNCAVFTEGFDDPGVSCVVMARPTKSRSLYAQMLGRGTRPADAIAGRLADYDSSENRRALITASNKPNVLVIDFAGNAGRHKLVTTVDILGACGSKPIPDDILDLAREAIKKAGKEGRSLTTEKAIAQAQEETRQRKMRESLRRAGVVGKATYSTTSIDPFDIFQIERTVERKSDHGRTLSEKQLECLRRFKIPNAENLPYHQAKRLLDECFRRLNSGEPTFGQLKMLRTLGVSFPVRSKSAAAALIDREMKAKGWK